MEQLLALKGKIVVRFEQGKPVDTEKYKVEHVDEKEIFLSLVSGKHKIGFSFPTSDVLSNKIILKVL